MAVDGFMDGEIIPFRIGMECLSEFCPTNGMSDHSGMHNADLIRSNIRHLLNVRGLTEAEAADRAGINQPWLNRFLRQDIKKPNQEKLALLAKALGVSAGDLTFVDLAGTAAVSPSQPVGSERAIVAAAVKLVSEMEAMSPEPLPRETYAERLYVAMKVVQEEGASGVLDDSNVIVALRRFAAELRKTG
jgi:transcriptional regulator with XRE-family HTH domain